MCNLMQLQASTTKVKLYSNYWDEKEIVPYLIKAKN